MSNVDYSIQKAPSFGEYKAAQPVKPSYLMLIEDAVTTKSKKVIKFICVDKPEFLNGFVQAKGFYCDDEPEQIIENYAALILNVEKEKIAEIFHPAARIINIRSLVYRAQKPQSSVAK